MNLYERNELIKKFQDEQMRILDAKGNDYAAGDAEDSGNANFEIVASLLPNAPIDELTVWAVYFLKHVCAILTFVRNRRVESEGMAERFNDVANYANIGRTILMEMDERAKEEENG